MSLYFFIRCSILGDLISCVFLKSILPKHCFWSASRLPCRIVEVLSHFASQVFFIKMQLYHFYLPFPFSNPLPLSQIYGL